jgi:pyruvate/2-oxoglutarate dehydrogenase complex dihydrolipoamide dehydrogenase (E3) component
MNKLDFEAMGRAEPTVTEELRTDVLVIGAGSGGLSFAAGAAQMGADVTLLEGGKMGGDCLNYGCVPSKALIAAAKQAHAMGAGEAYGIAPTAAQVDYRAAKGHVRRAIETIAPVDSQERFEGLGVRVIREYGRFTDARTVRAGRFRIRARRFVVATGSSPLVPPIPGLRDVPFETNETIFELMDRPDHLLVIGGGPIGMEMAQAHVRLGSKVTVIEGGRAMARDDPEMAAVVLVRLREEGVEIVEGARAERVSGGAGDLTIHTGKGDFRGTHILVAAGRRANIDGLGLDAAGVAHDRTITVDASLRSTNRRVYAVGDVAGRLQFTHVAGYHGATAIRPILFGLPGRVREDHVPWVTFTDPELAQVGLTEAEARERHGPRLEVLRFPFHENDRAVAEGKTEGLIKVMVVRGRPLGASIVGAQAGELIGLWALVFANRLKIGAVAAMVAPYPTLGEISKRAAGQYYVPRLFESSAVKRVVRLVQRVLP